jgi:serine/threonine protein kinase
MEGKLFKERYQLKRKLGAGRLGESYLADDLQLAREVVVKVLLPELASNTTYIERLEAESRVAAGLDSSVIVKPLDWGRQDDLYFVVTDYVEGQSLNQMLLPGARIPADRAARVISEICEALQQAHARGIIHCGLSTSNIFMDEFGRVRLMDLGMAWDATGRGTPQYVSPEQAKGLAMDARSDVYSLGIVFYEALTGRTPFEDADGQDVLGRQISEIPTEPTVIDPSIPAPLGAVIMKALTKDPALRYQSARQMRDALLGYLEGAAAPAPMAAPAPVTAGVVKESRAGAWALGIVIGLIVIGSIVVLLLGFAVGPKWFVSEDNTTTTVTVPNLTGLTEDQARSSLESAGLRMSRQDDYIASESQATGVVSSQSPAAGTSLAKGSSVTAKITTALRMPNVVGQSQKDATSTLNGQKITNVTVNNVAVTDAGQVGKVVKQDPAGGALISPGVSVTLQVGEAAKTVAVPGVVGSDKSAATTALQNAGFKVQSQDQASPTVPAGKVISQNPAAGAQADTGSTVTIVVSTGPA